MKDTKTKYIFKFDTKEEKMEVNRKREGVLKRKFVMSLYRAAKPASSSTMKYGSKVKQSPSASSPASVDFIVNRDYMTPQPKQTISFAPQPEKTHETYSTFENFYNSIAADESVDLKAASYISCVQERFRLEWVDANSKDNSNN